MGYCNNTELKERLRPTEVVQITKGKTICRKHSLSRSSNPSLHRMCTLHPWPWLPYS